MLESLEPMLLLITSQILISTMITSQILIHDHEVKLNKVMTSVLKDVNGVEEFAYNIDAGYYQRTLQSAWRNLFESFIY